MKNYKHCPICQGTEFRASRACIDYTVSKDKFTIVSCNNCAFEFTNPIPLEAEIGKYYESEDYISHSNKRSDLISRVYQFVRKIAIKNKLNFISELSDKKTILDIGSGTGEFLSHCRENGYKTLGIEPSVQARDFAKNKYKLEVHDEGKLKEMQNASMGIISMWHVMEHVYHLQDRVAEIHRILETDGLAIIAVPNRLSYDAKYYKEFWAAYDVPRHLYHFRPEDMIRLFKENNFKLVKTKGMKFDSFYVSMLSEKYKTGSSNLIKAIWIGFISNLLAKNKRESSTYSSQIYVFRKN